jgi:prepilin-type N-terminal cleavage/methylation domain-containing protein
METRENGVRNPEERKGFTLIEMMVVIAIIGILCGIAFVSMLHYRTIIRVNAAARDLAGEVRLARAQAINAGNSVLINFVDTGKAGYSYQIGSDPSESGTFTGYFRTNFLESGVIFGYYPGISAVPGHDYPVTQAIEVELGNHLYGKKVFFRQDGTASNSGVVYLIPEADLSSTGNRDDHSRSVDWDASTGRIRIWEWKYADHVWR